jgi:hypothetical protein
VVHGAINLDGARVVGPLSDSEFSPIADPWVFGRHERVPRRHRQLRREPLAATPLHQLLYADATGGQATFGTGPVHGVGALGKRATCAPIRVEAADDCSLSLYCVRL